MRYKKIYGNYTIKPGGSNEEVSDEEVVEYAMKHMRFIDRLSPRKVALVALVSHPVVCKLYTEPKMYEDFNEPYKFKFVRKKK